MSRECPEHDGQPADNCRWCYSAVTPRPDDFHEMVQQAIRNARADRQSEIREDMQP